MKLVDSTFIIDLLNGDRSAKLKSFELENELTPFTTELTTFEVTQGIFFGSVKKDQRLQELEKLLSRFIVLPLDHKAALRAGKIASSLYRKGRPIEISDSLIAGIALSNGIKTIVTKNKKHFKNIKELKVETY